MAESAQMLASEADEVVSPRVVHDTVIFRRQKHGGISEFWQRLTQQLHQESSVRWEWEPDKRLALFRPNRTPNAIFHSSYYRYSSGVNSKTVTTAHDFIHERGLVNGSPAWRNRVFVQVKQRALRRSTAIVCVSKATASDLKEFMPDVATSSRVSVIHHGPSLEPSPATARTNPVSSGCGYLLFVGGRAGYKNFELTLKALESASFRGNGIRLLVVGKPFTEVERKAVARMGLKAAVSNVGYVKNKDLAQLYEQATALVYPSGYEGFGLPVLDAMHLGCPVVAAAIPSVLEVAGDAAEFFEPNKPDALARAMQVVLGEKRRSHLRNLGLHRSREFSWEAAARKYVSVYRTIAQSH